MCAYYMPIYDNCIHDGIAILIYFTPILSRLPRSGCFLTRFHCNAFNHNGDETSPSEILQT